MTAAFDRLIWQFRERPLSVDGNNQASAADYTRRWLDQNRLSGADPTTEGGFVGSPISGFEGSGFMVLPGGGMNLTVAAGLGWQSAPSDVPASIGGVGNLDDSAAHKPLVLQAAQTIAVPANASGNPRVDIIEVAYRRLVGSPSSRMVLNAGTGTFAPASANKLLSFALDGSATINGSGPINYKTGTPSGGSAVAPANSAGYVTVAEVYVASGAVSLAAGVIKDARRLLFPGNVGYAGITFAFNSPGASAPTSPKVAAPPGVRVLARETVSAFAGEIYVIAGDVTDAHVVPWISCGNNTTQLSVPTIDATIVNIDHSTATDLADPSKTTPALGIASLFGSIQPGQQAIKLAFTLNKLDGTAIDANALVRVGCTWRRP